MDRQHTADADGDAPIVNYLPGMPPLSREPGRIQRALRALLARRGALRPVVTDDDTTYHPRTDDE